LERQDLFKNQKTTNTLRRLVGIFIGLLATSNLFAQAVSLKEMEDDLLRTYSKLFSFYQNDHDSLEKQSDLFSAIMVDYISKNPSTLDYPFKNLVDSNACDVVTSDDGLFRIYSWDTWMGGTEHLFQNIFQFGAGGKVYTKLLKHDDGEGSSFYSEIHTVKTGQKIYYLGIGNAIYSTKDAAKSIKVFTIENSSINDSVKLFKTRKELLNEIDVNFDFFSVVDHPERPVKLIKYDAAKKIVYIPVVEEKGWVTDRFIRYQFKGRYFEHILTQRPNDITSAVQVIDAIFEEYKENMEDTDSRENKEAMLNALKSLPAKVDAKILALLLDVWMYYDPTDFPTRKLIDPVFQKNKTTALNVVESRVKNKYNWENEENAPFSELSALKEKLLR